MRHIRLFENFKNDVVEFTPSTEQTLKNNGFTIKAYFNGDMNQGTISKNNQILGYYTKPEGSDYPLKKGDPMWGKSVIWSTTTGNELDKIIR